MKKYLDALFVSLLGMLLLVQKALAAIPTSDEFVTDYESTDGGFEIFYSLLQGAIQIAIAGVACYFGFGIARAAIEKYKDITDGRGSWIDLGGHILGGLFLLSLTIILVNWIGDWSSDSDDEG